MRRFGFRADGLCPAPRVHGLIFGGRAVPVAWLADGVCRTGLADCRLSSGARGFGLLFGAAESVGAGASSPAFGPFRPETVFRAPPRPGRLSRDW